MILHKHFDVNQEGHLTVGGMDTTLLAEKYGTPLYLIDENALREQCRIYRKAATESFGADGYLAETAVEFKKAFEQAVKSGKPTVIDVRIDKDEFVLPMLPPGGAISDIITQVK